MGSYPFLVQVQCQPLGWQAACASQICHVLELLFAGVEILTLGFYKDGSAPWRDEIDVEMWHGLLRTFPSAKSLRLRGELVGDLFRSLQLDEGELPLELLPELRELVPSAPLKEGLPPRWDYRSDPLRRGYYVDHNTRTTTWQAPYSVPAPITGTHPPSTRPAEVILSPDIIEYYDDYPDVRLPLGWEEWCTSYGRPFFVDHHKRATWNDPRQSLALTSAATTAALANSAALGPLPSGWEMHTTLTRRIYFADHNTRTATWDDPRLPSMVYEL